MAGGTCVCSEAWAGERCADRKEGGECRVHERCADQPLPLQLPMQHPAAQRVRTEVLALQ